jgi:hypothetical protein
MELTNEQYHADTTRISKSGLDLINKSPAHYYAKYLDPQRVIEPPTKSMILGTITHIAVLEPQYLEKNYFVLDDSKIISEIGGASPRSTTKYKEWKNEQIELNKSKQHVMIEDFDKVRRMRDAVHNHKTASQFLKGGIAEQTIYWTDSETGVKCKCRPDFDSHTGYLVDLKSTADASARGFGNSSFKYNYHVQAPFYLDGYNTAMPNKKQGFVFIAVESAPPYNVGVYFTTSDVYSLGKEQYLKGLKKYKQCLQTGIWEGYGDEILPLELPAWAYKNNNQ